MQFNLLPILVHDILFSSTFIVYMWLSFYECQAWSLHCLDCLVIQASTSCQSTQPYKFIWSYVL